MATQPMSSVQADAAEPVMFQLLKNGGKLSELNIDHVPSQSQDFYGCNVDLVIHNPALSIVGKSNSPHPFHLHGHKFWVIKDMPGPSSTFTYDTVADAQNDGMEFSLDNPPFRDGFDVQNDGYTIIRYIAGIGANMLHCHIGMLTFAFCVG